MLRAWKHVPELQHAPNLEYVPHGPGPKHVPGMNHAPALDYVSELEHVPALSPGACSNIMLQDWNMFEARNVLRAWNAK